MSSRLPSIDFNNGMSNPFIFDGKEALFKMEGGVPQMYFIRREPSFEKWNGDINCDPYIDHNDVSEFMRNYRLSPKDKRVMQGVFTLLSEEPVWVWRNAEIEVHGENISITFYAGSQSNKFVVIINANDKVSSSCREKGFRLRFSDGVKSIWNGIKSGAKAVLGALGGSAMKMIGFW